MEVAGATASATRFMSFTPIFIFTSMLLIYKPVVSLGDKGSVEWLHPMDSSSDTIYGHAHGCAIQCLIAQF